MVIGHILLMVNIGLDIFVKNPNSINWMKLAGFIALIPVIVLWPLPVFTLRKYGDINTNGSFMATSQLVEKGIYKVIRHPQYLGFMFLNASLALINQGIITFIVAILSIVFLIAGIKEEEHFLTEQFGDEYLQYQKRVPSIDLFTGIFRLIKR